VSIAPGDRLGPYEISAQIGVGGMGEVYRAIDTNLNRPVAIKVLPESVAGDADRLARFQREAQVLASLSHSNIASIYGLERAKGTTALVMELVEGPTLADRIAQGAIPVNEALPIAMQIADALEAAHEQRIIHRDLKPSNVKIRSDGTVKVLDFGLAKALDPSPAGTSNFSMSPTITTPAMTQMGLILGTAAYMSPEQARGKAVDRRADIWAFGCVLFEMLSGRRAFDAEDVSLTLARVLERDVDVSPLPSDVPVRVRQVIALCLRKDPRQRIGDIHDVRLALEGAFETPSRSDSAATATVSTRLRFATVAVVAALALVAAAALAFVHFREAPAAQRSVRFQVPSPDRSLIANFELSPDGRYLAVVTRRENSKLWVRAIDSLEARELPGTDGARYSPGQVFWSPDSSYIGFVVEGKLKKVSVNGGPPQTLTDVPDTARATWGREGSMLIAPGPASPIRRLPEAGGVSVPFTKTTALENHFTPQFLPDGRHALYYVIGSKPAANGVYLASLEEGAQPIRLLPDATMTRFTSVDGAGKSGYLLFIREGTLMAQRFDLEALRLTGEIFPVAEPVSQFSVSANGALAYMSGVAAGRQQLVWVDRAGKEVGSVGPPGVYSAFRLSPDEKSVVFNRPGAGQDIWTLDIARGVPSRITFDSNTDNVPIWSYDGLRILWPSNRGGAFDLYIKPASGTGQDELLIKMGTVNGWATDWSRDGKWILYQKPGGKTGQDLWIASPSPNAAGEQKPLLDSQFNERDGVFSPDGHWIAYVSNESGRDEVYVQTFPLTNEKHLISTGGGTEPEWRKDGAELFYLASDRDLMAVPIRVKANVFEPGIPKALFPVSGDGIRRAFAPSADGRFLIAKPLDETATTPITVVLNWRARAEP
jgi:serine/threonine protein kinase/Tol biopolymer transport system component